MVGIVRAPAQFGGHAGETSDVAFEAGRAPRGHVGQHRERRAAQDAEVQRAGLVQGCGYVGGTVVGALQEIAPAERRVREQTAALHPGGAPVAQAGVGIEQVRVGGVDRLDVVPFGDLDPRAEVAPHPVERIGGVEHRGAELVTHARHRRLGHARPTLQVERAGEGVGAAVRRSNIGAHHVVMALRIRGVEVIAIERGPGELVVAEAGGGVEPREVVAALGGDLVPIRHGGVRPEGGGGQGRQVVGLRAGRGQAEGGRGWPDDALLADGVALPADGHGAETAGDGGIVGGDGDGDRAVAAAGRRGERDPVPVIGRGPGTVAGYGDRIGLRGVRERFGGRIERDLVEAGAGVRDAPRADAGRVPRFHPVVMGLAGHHAEIVERIPGHGFGPQDGAVGRIDGVVPDLAGIGAGTNGPGEGDAVGVGVVAGGEAGRHRRHRQFAEGRLGEAQPTLQVERTDGIVVLDAVGVAAVGADHVVVAFGEIRIEARAAAGDPRDLAVAQAGGRVEAAELGRALGLDLVPVDHHRATAVGGGQQRRDVGGFGHRRTLPQRHRGHRLHRDPEPRLQEERVLLIPGVSARGAAVVAVRIVVVPRRVPAFAAPGDEHRLEVGLAGLPVEARETGGELAFQCVPFGHQGADAELLYQQSRGVVEVGAVGAEAVTGGGHHRLGEAVPRLQEERAERVVGVSGWRTRVGTDHVVMAGQVIRQEAVAVEGHPRDPAVGEAGLVEECRRIAGILVLEREPLGHGATGAQFGLDMGDDVARLRDRGSQAALDRGGGRPVEPARQQADHGRRHGKPRATTRRPAGAASAKGGGVHGFVGLLLQRDAPHPGTKADLRMDSLLAGKGNDSLASSFHEKSYAKSSRFR